MNAELKTFLQKKIGEPIQSVAPIVGGKVNQTFIINTATHQLVIRLNTAGELPRFYKEQWCIEKATERGVKSSQVLDIGSFGNHAYMLMPFIAGKRADQQEGDTPGIWHTLGSYAQKIHTIGSHGFGEKLEDIQHGNLKAWRQYLAYNITSLGDNDQLIQKGILTTEQSKKLKKYFEELQQKKLQFGLSHGDMSLLNTIVAADGVYLIDWGSAESHVVPHYDLGVILADSLHESSEEFNAVLAGYGLSRAEYDKIKDEIKSLMLLIAVDKIRWAIDRKPSALQTAVSHFNKIYKWKTEGASPLRRNFKDV